MRDLQPAQVLDALDKLMTNYCHRHWNCINNARADRQNLLARRCRAYAAGSDRRTMRVMPFVKFDWVAEEAFAEMPGWHPAVANVIPVAIRRWRKSVERQLFSGEWRKFKQRLREQHYDLVIDAQGLIKSALIARRAHAPIVGLDQKFGARTARRWFYQRKIAVPWDLHAVERVRSLFAQALEYPLPTIGDYGIDKNLFIDIVPRERRVLFLHGTTRADKHWPEVYWQHLCAGVRRRLSRAAAVGQYDRIRARAAHCRRRAQCRGAAAQNLHSLRIGNCHQQRSRRRRYRSRTFERRARCADRRAVWPDRSRQNWHVRIAPNTFAR